MLRCVRPLLGNRRYTKLYTRVLRFGGVDIAPYGICGFIAPSVLFDAYDRSRIHVGKNCFLTHDVILLVHDQSCVTAYNACNGSDEGTLYNPADIVIGDNVFIGMRSIVLPGTTIGDNVVIGAGSLVKGSIPAATVWAGNPAKQISTIGLYREKLQRAGAIPMIVYGNGASNAK